MAIITISRGSYSKGREVAEQTAARLGYRCISHEVVLDVSERYHLSENQLIKAMHDAPSVLERFSHDRTVFVAYYQSALARQVQEDNVVYHGLAGHLLLKGISHVLKVRIIVDLEERVRTEMAREKIPKQRALTLILKEDQHRRKWTQRLYGVDPWDVSLYDFVLRIHKLTVADAVDFICRAAALPQFEATGESRQDMDDLVLASGVKAALIHDYPDISVAAEYGNVLIYTKTDDRSSHRLKEDAQSLCRDNPKITSVEVHGGVDAPSRAI